MMIMFGRLLHQYTIYTFLGALAPNGILPGAKLTLCPRLAFSYIGSVTARHSSSERQANSGVQQRAPPTYSAGWPSRASAHILFGFETAVTSTDSSFLLGFINNRFCSHMFIRALIALVSVYLSVL